MGSYYEAAITNILASFGIEFLHNHRCSDDALFRFDLLLDVPVIYFKSWMSLPDMPKATSWLRTAAYIHR